jgi:hypothetical protein
MKTKTVYQVMVIGFGGCATVGPEYDSKVVAEKIAARYRVQAHQRNQKKQYTVKQVEKAVQS